MIYFITDGEFTKIGKTNNVSKRLSSIQTGNPKHIRVALVFKGGEKKEKELHEFFRKRRVVGEWFNGVPESFINDLINKFSSEAVIGAILKASKEANHYELDKRVLNSFSNKERDASVVVSVVKKRIKECREVISIESLSRDTGLDNKFIRRTIDSHGLLSKINKYNSNLLI